MVRFDIGYLDYEFGFGDTKRMFVRDLLCEVSQYRHHFVPYAP